MVIVFLSVSTLCGAVDKSRMPDSVPTSISDVTNNKCHCSQPFYPTNNIHHEASAEFLLYYVGGCTQIHGDRSVGRRGGRDYYRRHQQNIH